MKKFAIALHGGAGTILRSAMTPEKEAAYTAALQAALNIGYAILENGGSALEAVEQTVVSLEDCPLFNAGRGSVFTADGKHEMDASIMDGLTRDAGAVSMVSGVRNPITLARLVMAESGHVMLAGEGAMDFARSMKVPFEPESYFHDDFRWNQWQEMRGSDGFQLDHSAKKDEKFGTVGAVALDIKGNIAAATSTGGMTNKKFGRIGDSPIIGAGTYAHNKTCAVSCTGSGEFFIRGVVAYDVSCLMEYKGLSLQTACDEVVQRRLMEIGGDGGLVTLDAAGNIALVFNTEGMYRACRDSAGRNEVAIYGGEILRKYTGY
ncbi:MAG: isoaspartyl peptidase/L-asparaginase [Bacteroidetes bacterium]|nr:isoaspartyl peptidase/L-asparaginase [Bacteroidota bacterium]